MDGQADRQTDGWMDGQTTHGRTDGWKNRKKTDAWIDGQTDGWLDRWKNGWSTQMWVHIHQHSSTPTHDWFTWQNVQEGDKTIHYERLYRERTPQPSQLKSSKALIRAKAVIHQTHNHTFSLSEGGTVNTFVASTHAGRWRGWVSWAWVGDGLKTKHRTGNWGCPMISLWFITMHHVRYNIIMGQPETTRWTVQATSVYKTKIILPSWEVQGEKWKICCCCCCLFVFLLKNESFGNQTIFEECW